MIDWQPASGPETAALRAERLAVVRRFFGERNVLEVDVPALNRAGISDPNIDSLEVSARMAGGQTLYLTTSPEYAMKRLLAAGYPDIYSIARVFRDSELGRRHEPEFTLIEWYRRDFDLAEMARETCELIAAVLDRPALATERESIGYRQAFADIAGVDALAAPLAALVDLAETDTGLRAALGDDRDAWLDLLLSTRIAPAFPDDRLTVLSHYPASQAALARLDESDPAVALRFEVFLGEIELANGYVELADAEEQRQRFELEQAKRHAAGRPSLPLDAAFLAALESGLPDCAGVAVGFERLHMLYAGADEIADVITFSFRSST